MFTGIIKYKSKVIKILKKNKNIKLWIELKEIDNISLGDSIAINGVCLTVNEIDKNNNLVLFDIMEETLEKTTFKFLTENSYVNIEFSLSLNHRLHGHIVYGDVDSIGKIIKIQKLENSHIFIFKIPKKFQIYLIEKGRISIDGASLTIVEVNKNIFSISLTKYSLAILTLKDKEVNDYVNLEYDIIIKSILNYEKNK